MKRPALALTLILPILISVLAVTQSVNLASANPYIVPERSPTSIYIETDGSITPSTAPIHRNGHFYSLTENIYNRSIWIQHDNSVLDGAGYTLQGNGSEKGVVLNCTKNVTVKNMQIRGYSTGVLIQRQAGPKPSPFDTNPSNPYPESSNNIIRWCTVTENGLNGISVRFSSDNQVTGNQIASCHYGISLLGNGNEISGNGLQNNVCGIQIVDGSTGNAISENDITESRDYGIALLSSSSNFVAHNLLLNNGFGIVISGSTDNSIIGNMIAENNGWGMLLETSQSNNLIYRNDFIDNKADGLQVSIPLYFGFHTAGATAYSIPGLANEWDNGKEGNYWSDYTTRYANASEIGDSGIGDTPFYINPNNIDNHPFMKPCSGIPFPSTNPTSSSPDQSSTATASPDHSSTDAISDSEPIPETWIIVSMFSVIAISAGIVFHFRKRKKVN